MDPSDVTPHSSQTEITPRSSQILGDECSNPYYLHHSDSPGISLVSQPLTGDNYTAWSRAMMISLSVKNKIGFIDGSIEKPSSDSSLLNAWVRCNNVVLSWILNSVSKDISASILYSNSAKDVWNDLKERYQQQNGPRIFQLRKEIMNLAQNQTSVAVYFTKLKALWEEMSNFRPQCTCGICTCGGVHQLQNYYNMEYILTFLMGLNESYSSVRGQILLLDPMPPISKVFSLISQEERQRQVSISDGASGVVFSSATDSASKNVENKSRPPSASTKRKDKPYCTHCKMTGHTIDKCYKLHGFPPGYKRLSSSSRVNMVTDHPVPESPHSTDFFKSLSSDQCNQLMSLLSAHVQSSQPTTGSSLIETPHAGGQVQESDWQG